jgi:hypothetical protein
VPASASGVNAQTVFSIDLILIKTEEKQESKEEKEEKEETKEKQDEIPPLVHLAQSRGWITSKRFSTKRHVHNTHPLNGPTFESNLLIPKVGGLTFGALCVGSYPETHNKYLSKLLDAGYNTFVCLCSEYGLIEKGNYYEPYAKNNPRIPAGNFIHKRIMDMDVCVDKDIEEVATEIVKRLKRGENVYLHCKGGHGRTGVCAGVALHKLYPELTSTEIFEYLQFGHDQRDGYICGSNMWTGMMIPDPLASYFSKGQVPTPQTGEQRNQVRRLMGEREY